ncbi:hypothetical protein SROCM77S_06131 [Streptomyces rochei]
MATASSARPLAGSRKLRYRRAGDEATGADGSPERVRRCRARRFTRLFVSTASGRSQILVRRAAPQHADSEEARAARAPQTAQPTITYRLGPCVSLPRPDLPSGSFVVVEPPTERTCLDLPAENDDGHHLEHHCHAGEPQHQFDGCGAEGDHHVRAAPGRRRGTEPQRPRGRRLSRALGLGTVSSFWSTVRSASHSVAMRERSLTDRGDTARGLFSPEFPCARTPRAAAGARLVGNGVRRVRRAGDQGWAGGVAGTSP